jgi:hypothetical protein
MSMIEQHATGVAVPPKISSPEKSRCRGVRMSNSQFPRTPFLRSWPRAENLLAAVLNLVFSGGNFLVQFFKPVHHDVDLCRLHRGFQHQEFLAVGGYVVIGG